jgi:hypothetical protein
MSKGGCIRTGECTDKAKSDSTVLLDDGEHGCCLICGGEGTVMGQDYFDWDEDEYNDPCATCPSCHGSGKAEDMTFC